MPIRRKNDPAPPGVHWTPPNVVYHSRERDKGGLAIEDNDAVRFIRTPWNGAPDIFAPPDKVDTQAMTEYCEMVFWVDKNGAVHIVPSLFNTATMAIFLSDALS